MKSEKILFNDFDLFLDAMKATSKILESAKLIVNENGLSIFGARQKIARCEVITNAIYSTNPVEFSILDLNMFVKILHTIKDIHQDDYSDLTFLKDENSIKFKSKKFKTKLSLCKDDIIEKWISTKIKTELKPVFEFKTSSDIIKSVMNHSFIFADQTMLRIYLQTNKDMENNILYAMLGNKNTDLSNEITLKLGYVTSGSIENKDIILDLERLNLFNVIQSNEIKISLMNHPILVSNISINGKNDSFFKLNIYNTILKN